jgi:hypothetical protein
MFLIAGARSLTIHTSRFSAEMRRAELPLADRMILRCGKGGVQLNGKENYKESFLHVLFFESDIERNTSYSGRGGNTKSSKGCRSPNNELRQTVRHAKQRGARRALCASLFHCFIKRTLLFGQQA